MPEADQKRGPSRCSNPRNTGTHAVGGGAASGESNPGPTHYECPGHRPAVDEAGGLRIMQQHDVTRPDQLAQAGLVVFKRARIVLVLGGAEVVARERSAVQRVVKPLGDREERRIGVEHQPPSVDPRAASVSEQRLQHLRDATTVGSGIDIPHDPPGQMGTSPSGGRHEPLRPIPGQQRAEHLQRRSLDLDLPHRAMMSPTSGSWADEGAVDCHHDPVLGAESPLAHCGEPDGHIASRHRLVAEPSGDLCARVRLHHRRGRFGWLCPREPAPEKSDISVLLLEAGGSGRHPNVMIPAAFAKLFKTSRDWGYSYAAQPSVGGRELFTPAARCSAARPRLTRWSTSVAIAPTTTRGPPAMRRAGATTRFCRTSSSPNATSGSMTPSTAKAARYTSPTCARETR